MSAKAVDEYIYDIEVILMKSELNTKTSNEVYELLDNIRILNKAKDVALESRVGQPVADTDGECNKHIVSNRTSNENKPIRYKIHSSENH